MIEFFKGFPFYEKAMMISFAKRESHVITQAKKYVPPKDERTLAKGSSTNKRFEILSKMLKRQMRNLQRRRNPREMKKSQQRLFTLKIYQTKRTRACSICFSRNFQASRKADRSRQAEKVTIFR